MVERTGINGIVQAKLDNMNAKMEQLAAKTDYIAMLCDVDIPIEGEMNDEQEI